MLKIYEYNKCSTCRKALTFLDEGDLPYKKIPIVEKPPSEKELKFVLEQIKSRGGTFKNLFNTSGELYREFKISDKMKSGMTEREAIRLLSSHGKLIKRPFLISEEVGLVGFKKEEWTEYLL